MKHIDNFARDIIDYLDSEYSDDYCYETVTTIRHRKGNTPSFYIELEVYYKNELLKIIPENQMCTCYLKWLESKQDKNPRASWKVELLNTIEGS